MSTNNIFEFVLDLHFVFAFEILRLYLTCILCLHLSVFDLVKRVIAEELQMARLSELGSS